MISKVRSVGIYVADQQRALEFYRDVLGLPELGARLSLERAPSISTRAERIQFV